MDTVFGLDETTTNEHEATNVVLNQIVFQVNWNDGVHNITIERQKLEQWRLLSEYIDVLLNYSKHDSPTIEVKLPNTIDLFSLLLVFRFFEKTQITKLSVDENNSLLQTLAFFGVESKILQSIRRGLGMMYELHPLDSEDNQVHQLTQTEYTNLRTRFSKSQSIVKSFYHYKLLRSMKHTYPNSNTIDQVLTKFHSKTHNLFIDVDHIIVCGSSVIQLFCYSQIPNNVAYDVFFTTLDYSIAQTIIESIKAKIESTLKCECHVAVTPNSTILFCEFIVIQFVTSLFENINNVLNSFDLDCCCVGIQKYKVYAINRFVRSLEYGGNIFQPQKQSVYYFHRIQQYISRGFLLFVPGVNLSDPTYIQNNPMIEFMNNAQKQYTTNNISYLFPIVHFIFKCEKQPFLLKEYLKSPKSISFTQNIPHKINLSFENVFIYKETCLSWQPLIQWTTDNIFAKSIQTSPLQLYHSLYNCPYIL
jgi:hypothetical protein